MRRVSWSSKPLQNRNTWCTGGGRHDFTLPVCEVDLRPGGVFRFCMRSPNGRDYWVRGVYQQICPPSRLVFRYGLENEELSHDSLVTVTFEELNGRTRLTLYQVLLDPAQGRKGASEGWVQGLESLEKHLHKLSDKK